VFNERTAAGALAIIKDTQVDLILCDVHVENGVNGFDFLRSVKQDKRTSEILFVFVSICPNATARMVEEGARAAARLLGAAGFISVRSFDPGTFCDEIDSIVAGSNRRTKITAKPDSRL